jgi:nitroreductase
VREGFRTWTPTDDYINRIDALRQHTQKDGYSFYYQAPTLIIASNRPNYQNAVTDCACALQNIFLAAHSIGLGSCYINQLHWLENDSEIRKYLLELSIPAEHTICSAAAIGYIDKQSSPPPRSDSTIKIVY